MTNTATPEMREFAARLLAGEAAAALPEQGNQPVAFRVCEKLGRSLTTLAGAVGFQSLLSRALTLAKRRVPSLNNVEVSEEGSLTDSGEVGLEQSDAEGEVLLVAYLLGLLFSVIGETLTLRLIHDIWPNANLMAVTSGRDR